MLDSSANRNDVWRLAGSDLDGGRPYSRKACIQSNKWYVRSARVPELHLLRRLVDSGKMNSDAAGRRVMRKRRKAAQAVLSGSMTLRQTAEKYKVAKSTVYDDVRKARNPPPSPKKAGRKCAFSKEEEEVIIKTLLHYSDRGVPLSRTNLWEAVISFIELLPEERKAQLPFTNGRPKKDWIFDFEARIEERVDFKKPIPQESNRFAAVNAETLVTHFATLEKLVNDERIDSMRMWNLDETGSSPGRSARGSSA